MSSACDCRRALVLTNCRACSGGEAWAFRYIRESSGLAYETAIGLEGQPRDDFGLRSAIRSRARTRIAGLEPERFTRVAEDQIEYEMTIEDPEVLTDKWTVSYPMFLDPEYEFFEYACHEGNTAIRNYIETSRYERRQQGE